ncbi:MAG TPA: tetratricopeptide repeat protein [Burkholderiales bacterium]|nr:tetratricopeptide repeat protein [Burkholderiales bacterium]
MIRLPMVKTLSSSLSSYSRIVVFAVVSLAACGSLSQTAGAPDSEDPAEANLQDLMVGEIALQRGEVGLAAQTYLDVAKRTGDPRIARRAIEIASAARMPELAAEAAGIWYAAEPSTQSLQALAAFLVGAKRVDEAEPYLEKLLDTSGVNVESFFLQVNRLLAGNPDKAANLRVVRKLAARKPELAQAHFAVAQAAFAAGDDAAALESVRQAEALRPDWELAVIFEAQLLQKRSPAEAGKRLAAFIEKNPGARDARLNYARMLVLDHRYADARKQFEAVLAANPGNPDVTYAVGLLAFQLRDFPVAEQNLKKLLGSGYRDPNAVRYLLGQIAEEQKHWQQAIDWYKQIQTGDQAFAARLRTANALARQGKIDEGRAFLQRIEPEGPGDRVQLIVAEAQLLRDANRTRDAYDLLGGALKSEPEQPELLYDYALTAEKMKRFDVLESNLRKLMQVKPDHAHAYNALGYSFAERNTRLPEARKLIEKALELAPDDYFIMDSMGWVLYRQGDLKGAARELQRAYDGRPDAEIGAHLGEVLWVLGDRGEADRVWKQSLDSSPENETLLNTIKRLKR